MTEYSNKTIQQLNNDYKTFMKNKKLNLNTYVTLNDDFRKFLEIYKNKATNNSRKKEIETLLSYPTQDVASKFNVWGCSCGRAKKPVIQPSSSPSVTSSPPPSPPPLSSSVIPSVASEVKELSKDEYIQLNKKGWYKVIITYNEDGKIIGNPPARMEYDDNNNIIYKEMPIKDDSKISNQKPTGDEVYIKFGSDNKVVRKKDGGGTTFRYNTIQFKTIDEINKYENQQGGYKRRKRTKRKSRRLRRKSRKSLR